MLWLVALLLFISVDKGDLQTIKTKYGCPSNFHLVGSKCYYFGEKDVTWQDSHYYCQTLNASLAIIQSHREVNLLRDYLNETVSVLGNYERWIDGIYDWKQRTWKWGVSGQKITFNKFSRLKLGPEFNWTCIVVNPLKQNRWTARKCTDKRRYVCEADITTSIQFKIYTKRVKKRLNIAKCSKPKSLTKYEQRKCLKLLGTIDDIEPAYIIDKPKPTESVMDPVGFVCPSHMVGLGNRCYYFSQDKATWWDAFHKCYQNRSKLAIVRNRSQDLNLRIFLNNFIEKHDRWIGGKYDWHARVWKWAQNAQPLKYKGFEKRVIKNRSNEDLQWNAVFMDPTLENRWNSASEMNEKRYICQVKAKAVRRFSHPKLKPPQATIRIITR